MANALANIKKGDKVILRMFTGAFVGAKDVVKADKSSISVETAKGIIKFSLKTGKQVDPEPKQERFANYIEEFDEDTVKAEEKKRAKSLKKSAKVRKAKAEERKAKEEELAAAAEEAEQDEDSMPAPSEHLEGEAEPPKKVKKVKKKMKKVAKAAPVESEDDDEIEELD